MQPFQRLLAMVLTAVRVVLSLVLASLGVATLLGVLSVSFYFAGGLLDGFMDKSWGQRVGPIVGVLCLMGVPTVLGFILFSAARGAERHVLLRKYLGKKLAPMFALVAVTLCTAMVIIVISVMGGFHSLMSNAMQQLSGDVSIRAGLQGFPYYEKLIKKLEAREEIIAATPVIQSFGLLNIHGQSHTVEVYGVIPDSLDRVVGAQGSGSNGGGGGYRGSLYWTQDRLNAERKYLVDAGYSSFGIGAFDRKRDVFDRFDLESLAMRFEAPDAYPFDRTKRPRRNDGGNGPLRDDAKPDADEKPAGDEPAAPKHGIVLGIEVDPNNRRTEQGSYLFLQSMSLAAPATLTVVPLSDAGGVLAVESATEQFTVVNEFKSGLFDVDANRVYVPFTVLQDMLQMQRKEEFENFDPITGEPVGEPTIRPARASTVLVRGNASVTLDALSKIVWQVRDEVAAEHDDFRDAYVLTWRQQFAGLLGAVQNEKGLLTFLFGFISLVAIVMIGVIFYMIVLSKTRDIGTLRAIGATRGGVMAIFLGYGMTIGSIGSGLGLVIAWLIVTYLNSIHEWLANGLGSGVFVVGIAVGAGLFLGLPIGAVWGYVGKSTRQSSLQRATRLGARVALALAVIGAVVALTLLSVSEGLAESLNGAISIKIWDPRVYFFDRIPAKIDWHEVGVILIVAVCSSVVGALLPSYRAGLVDPVESLRYE